MTAERERKREREREGHPYLQDLGQLLMLEISKYQIFHIPSEAGQQVPAKREGSHDPAAGHIMSCDQLVSQESREVFFNVNIKHCCEMMIAIVSHQSKYGNLPGRDGGVCEGEKVRVCKSDRVSV